MGDDIGSEKTKAVIVEIFDENVNQLIGRWNKLNLIHVGENELSYEMII